MSSNVRGREAVMGDDMLVEHGLKKRNEWSRDMWEAFQAGWSNARIGSPEKPDAGRLLGYFEQGQREAKHFAPRQEA